MWLFHLQKDHHCVDCNSNRLKFLFSHIHDGLRHFFESAHFVKAEKVSEKGVKAGEYQCSQPLGDFRFILSNVSILFIVC